MNEERDSIKMTPKMLDFFMAVSNEYVQQCPGLPNSEAHFKFVCDKMLNHEDKDIKVQFSRVLMYMGFNSVVECIGESVEDMLKKVLCGGK